MNKISNLVTDYLLFAQGIWFAWALFATFRAQRQSTHFCWALAFAFLGLASLAGGTYHGFVGIWPEWITAACWVTTIYSAGTLALLLFLGTAYAALPPGYRKVALWVGGVQYVVFSIWMLDKTDFLWVIIDYGAAMLASLVMIVASPGRNGGKYVAAGIVASFAGAGLQQAKVGLNTNIDHNDIYHLMQIGSNYLLFKGAQLGSDRC